MSVKCPKCGYQRVETDSVPDWQCPSCGVAYNKVASSPYKVIDSDSRKRRSSLPLVIVGVFCVSLLGGAAYGTKEFIAYNRVQSYKGDLETLKTFTDEWEAKKRLASQTPRIALSNRVAALQELQKNWGSVTFKSDCIAVAKGTYNRSMGHTIEGFIHFMGQDQAESTDSMIAGLKTHTEFLDAVVACQPPGYTP